MESENVVDVNRCEKNMRSPKKLAELEVASKSGI
jgi:hypothetical protein